LIAELRTKTSCGIAIADLQNLTSAIPQLSTVSCQFRYVIVPFASAQDGFKNQPKLFLELFVSLETKLALKGQLHEIFFSDFFVDE
jgi:hypothetical protein